MEKITWILLVSHSFLALISFLNLLEGRNIQLNIIDVLRQIIYISLFISYLCKLENEKLNKE